MKNLPCASMLALFMLSFALPQLTVAQTSAPSAYGSLRFGLDDGLTKSVEFDARTVDGRTTGLMTFTDQSGISDQDTDGFDATRLNDSSSSFYIKAEFDCLVVEKNRALMCGTIKESSHKGYIGNRVMLMVEDSGDYIRTPDRVFWGMYKPTGGWIPTDAERPDDTGASLTWIATDAERKDDVGVPSRKSAVVACQSFSLSASYSFKEGEGNIVVRP